MNNKSRRATIRDVARHAGVSITTVSNALSGRGRLAPATRERVAASAAELDYRPLASAQRLRGGRTGQIGLYCSYFAHSPEGMSGTGFYLRLVIAAAESTFAAGMGLTLLPPTLDATRLNAIDVDGLLILDPMLDDPALAALARLRVPTVTSEYDPNPGAQHDGCVRSDHVAAIGELLDHVYDAGARRVALITVAGGETTWTHELRSGYTSWCGEHGLEPAISELEEAPSATDAAALTEELISGPHPPDAFVCAPDGAALHVQSTLVRRGLVVGRDVLVASCVDGAAMASATPSITAIDVKPAEVAQMMTRLLAAIIAGEEVETEQILETTLNVRASTAGPTTPA